MIPVSCVTNLDGPKMLAWPDYLPAVPNMGDYIESKTILDNNRRCDLKVCRITWKYSKLQDRWYAEIEMTVPSRFENLTHFYTWFASLTGQSVHAYI